MKVKGCCLFSLRLRSSLELHIRDLNHFEVATERKVNVLLPSQLICFGNNSPTTKRESEQHTCFMRLSLNM